MELILNKEEYEFIKRFCMRALVLIEMNCKNVEAGIEKEKIQELLNKLGERWKSN